MAMTSGTSIRLRSGIRLDGRNHIVKGCSINGNSLPIMEMMGACKHVNPNIFVLVDEGVHMRMYGKGSNEAIRGRSDKVRIFYKQP